MKRSEASAGFSGALEISWISSEHGGKVDPCHNLDLCCRLEQRKGPRAGLFRWAYWARTSDPQLVDMERTFAPVRSGALRQSPLSETIRSTERLSEPERTVNLAILATPGTSAHTGLRPYLRGAASR